MKTSEFVLFILVKNNYFCHVLYYQQKILVCEEANTGDVIIFPINVLNSLFF